MLFGELGKHECGSCFCRSEGFTLHGLWPNLDNLCHDDFPEYCSKENFNANNLNDDLYSEMEAVWPSYTTGVHQASACCCATLLYVIDLHIYRFKLDL